MNEIAIPSPLHDVLGKHQSGPSLVLIGGVAAIALIATAPALVGIPVWRSVVVALLIADIAAGAVANLTAATNDHYAARPRSRWIFLAVHVHLPVVALLLGAPLAPAIIVWAATIAAGSIVNLLAAGAVQRAAGGAAFAVILCLVLTLPDQHPALLVVSSLFAFKVVYAFAVDHGGDCRTGDDE